MDEARIRELILEKVVDGRLSCSAAHNIAQEHGVPLGTIGRLCNEPELKVKITGCMLGCF